MSKSKDVQEKLEFIQIRVPVKDVDKIIAGQHEKFSKTELSQMGQFYMAMAFVQSAKALLSVVSKEKAKEAMAKAVYDFVFMRAKAAAEERGNPKDLKRYMDFEYEAMSKHPFIPPPEILEETKTKVVLGIRHCPFADAVREFAELMSDYVDQDVLEV